MHCVVASLCPTNVGKHARRCPVHAFFKSDKMCDFVGMPKKFTCVDRTGHAEWLSPSNVGVPRWDADHSHLPQSCREAKTCFSWLMRN